MLFCRRSRQKSRGEAIDQIKEAFIEEYNNAHTDLTEDELSEKHALVDRYYDDV